jgi:hypothetical protein
VHVDSFADSGDMLKLKKAFLHNWEQDQTADLRVMNGEIYAIQALC